MGRVTFNDRLQDVFDHAEEELLAALQSFERRRARGFGGRAGAALRLGEPVHGIAASAGDELLEGQAVLIRIGAVEPRLDHRPLFGAVGHQHAAWCGRVAVEICGAGVALLL